MGFAHKVCNISYLVAAASAAATAVACGVAHGDNEAIAYLLHFKFMLAAELVVHMVAHLQRFKERCIFGV